MFDTPMLTPGERVATEFTADDISLLIDSLDGTLTLFNSAEQKEQVDKMLSRLVALFLQLSK